MSPWRAAHLKRYAAQPVKPNLPNTNQGDVTYVSRAIEQFQAWIDYHHD